MRASRSVVRYAVCHSEEDLARHIRFSHLPGGFSHYANQMGLASIWPMAYFVWLEVDSSFLRQGFGRAGLRSFRAAAIGHGCQCGFMRVGWGDLGPADADPAWRQKFYEEEGWILLQNATPAFVIPILYLPLSGTSGHTV